MGPIDPEGSDAKAIVIVPSSCDSSSLNMVASAPVMPNTDERPAMITVTITDVDGTHRTNGEAAASSGPVQMPDVAHPPPSGYSSAYVTNRMHNIQLGGKTPRRGQNFLFMFYGSSLVAHRSSVDAATTFVSQRGNKIRLEK